MRIRVEVDLSQPLMRGLRIRLDEGGARWLSFKYEKLPYFCYTCGMLGHRDMDCSQRFEEEHDSDSEELPYPKSLMVAPFRSLTPKGLSKSVNSSRAAEQMVVGVARGCQDKEKMVGSLDDTVSSSPGDNLGNDLSLSFEKVGIKEGLAENLANPGNMGNFELEQSLSLLGIKDGSCDHNFMTASEVVSCSLKNGPNLPKESGPVSDTQLGSVTLKILKILLRQEAQQWKIILRSLMW